MSRNLNKDETKYILSIQEKDISSSLLKKLFAKTSVEDPPIFNTNDTFILPANYCGNKKEGYTTIGTYIFNRFIIEPNFLSIFGYINKSITGPQLEEIEDKIANSLYTDKINGNQYADYLNRIQWIGGNDICSIISPSISAAILKPPEGLKELKETLKQENKKAIEDGDAIVGSEIESKLVKYAESKLKDDPGFENFLSKAKASVGNNYKTMNINFSVFIQ